MKDNQSQKGFSQLINRIVISRIVWANGCEVKLGIDLHARDGALCV
jgi:hypothetical protein